MIKKDGRGGKFWKQELMAGLWIKSEKQITRHFIKPAEGSVLIDAIQGHLYRFRGRRFFFMKGEGRGWITAEYSMLPGATEQRTVRKRPRKVDGPHPGNQRLIGRALRSVIDLTSRERTIWIDVTSFRDGGTRTLPLQEFCGFNGCFGLFAKE